MPDPSGSRRAPRLIRRFARGLEPEIRENAFEPAYNDVLAGYAEASAHGSGIRRAVVCMGFVLRSVILVAECYRLQGAFAPRRVRRWATAAASVLRDVRHAIRAIRRRPLYAAVAILTLALGIGANTAVFSVVNAVMLRSLPYADSERLAMVWGNNAQSGSPRDPHSPETFRDYVNGLTAAETVAGITPQWNFTIRGNGEPERVPGFWASADFLPMLGAKPLRGQLFGPMDDRPDASLVAVISHGLWQRRFGGDADIVGRAIDTSAGSATIVGVLPPDFRWLEDADVWVPMQQNPIWATGGRRVRLFSIVAQLAADRTMEDLRSDVTALATRLATAYPEEQASITARVVPLLDDVIGGIRPALMVLLGAVGLVLLISCVNVANLMLVRSDGRRREVALRAALGASRRRLAREMMIESLILAIIGGVCGFLVALAGVRALASMVPAAVPRRGEIVVDPAMLIFAMALALLAGMLFGLVPALAAMRADPGASLREGALGTGVRKTRLRRTLVVSEVAVALVVLVGSMLLVRSFSRLRAVDPGFETAHVLSMDLSGLPGAERFAFMETLYEELEGVPGVLAAGEVSRVPLAGRSNITSRLDILSRPLPPNEQPEIDFRRASRGYFEAMGIDLLRGRGFERSDDADSEPVALINAIVAERHFGDLDPLGERITLGGGKAVRIIGVVGAVHHASLRDAPRPEVYVHTLQGALGNPQLLVRTSADPVAAAGAVRSALRRAGPGLVISNVTTMERIRSESLAGPRFNTALFGLFAILAVVLSTVGAWGVMAYTVAQRRREFGLRISIGARPRDIAAMVLLDGARLAGAGLVIGAVAALAGGRLMRRLLYETEPTDLATFLAAGATLLGAILFAAAVSAIRATRLDPVRALQAD